MARLEVRLLGRLEVLRDGSEITELGSDTAKALLALLASEPGRVWSRAAIAELLWPDRPPGGALGNLRHTLSELRRALDDGTTLVTDRTTIALARTEAAWVDVVEFEGLTGVSADTPNALAAWHQATELWRGEFLEGLQPAVSAEWEDWKRTTAERYRRNLAGAVRHIADWYESIGELDGVVETARRLIEIDPWDERAHRRLMHALASRGEHTQAVAHYSELARRFSDDYGTLPSPPTTALAERIRRGAASEAQPEVAGIPSEWLNDLPEEPARSVFVGRERELEALQTHLTGVRSGQGRLVLVAGEAGSGKTTLMTEFMQRATDVRTALGRCNALAGLGDPYLPFREVLSLLGGDVEARLKTGALTVEQATRLWERMPQVARLIDQHAPHLLGVMIDGISLVRRVARIAPDAAWLDGLRKRVETMTNSTGMNRIQPALFDEYTAVLAEAAEDSPAVVVIDDLQWADAGSIALLWHLVRRLDRLRVLIVGAYRPEEITSDNGAPHAIASILRELSVQADQTIELGTDRHFVDALIDAEPNKLDDQFRTRLFSFTGGHALFTVETLRGMQEHGEIVRDAAGAWVQQESLRWDNVPQRVEAAIERRIARLGDEVAADLAAASIQGEEFIAEVAAAARCDPSALARLLDHARSVDRVVEQVAVERIGERLATRYRFRHELFQQYLYGILDDAKHVRLHEATACSLEKLYSGHPDQPVVDLAYHFDKARLLEPAIDYHQQAAQRARDMAANEEAIGLLERAHELLHELPTSTDRDQREVELLVLLAAPINIARGWGTPEARRVSDRIHQLIDRAKPSIPAALALIRLAGSDIVAGRFTEAVPWTERSLAFADAIGNSTLRSAAAFEVGVCLESLGQHEAAHRVFRFAYEVDDHPDPEVINAYGADPAPQALSFDGFATLGRGYPEQALALCERAVKLARTRDDPFTLCHVLASAANMRAILGDHEGAMEGVEELEQILAEHHFPYFAADALRLRGALAGERGDYETGIDLIEDALAQFRSMGISAWQQEDLVALAEFEHRRGEPDRALRVILAAEEEISRTGEPFTALFLSVERARLLRLGRDEAAEAALLDALSDAASMRDRGIELMAATELALLYEAEGRIAEAHDVLAPRYERFTEGFDTRMLVDARKVLDRLK